MPGCSHLRIDTLSRAAVPAQCPRPQLSCKHCFHELCIRGWTVVGKKDSCPCCLEKVDLRDLYAQRPWETKNLSWIQMLDALRYMVVWNPIIFTVSDVPRLPYAAYHSNVLTDVIQSPFFMGPFLHATARAPRIRRLLSFAPVLLQIFAIATALQGHVHGCTLIAPPLLLCCTAGLQRRHPFLCAAPPPSPSATAGGLS